MGSPTRARPAQPIGEVAITPRPLSDYRNMFLLDDDDLFSGPILDCPGGASPFGAQVRARGGVVVSVDPVYDQPLEVLVARVRADLDRTAAWMAAHPGNFDWSYLGSAQAVTRAFEVAAELFATDYAPDGRRYVAAQLPHLPFGEGWFRLTLSSHLLFVYPRAARLRRARCQPARAGPGHLRGGARVPVGGHGGAGVPAAGRGARRARSPGRAQRAPDRAVRLAARREPAARMPTAAVTTRNDWLRGSRRRWAHPPSRPCRPPRP
jgi:hypothetical protein